jgi:hypothetical protein
MNRKAKGTLRAGAVGGAIGGVVGAMMTPADSVGHKIVENVYGGPGQLVPTVIHHASQAPAGALTGAAIAAGVVGGAHLVRSMRQFGK